MSLSVLLQYAGVVALFPLSIHVYQDMTFSICNSSAESFLERLWWSAQFAWTLMNFHDEVAAMKTLCGLLHRSR